MTKEIPFYTPEGACTIQCYMKYESILQQIILCSAILEVWQFATRPCACKHILVRHARVQTLLKHSLARLQEFVSLLLHGAFHVKPTLEVGQQLLRCRPTLKVSIHLRCRDQKSHASRYAFYNISIPKAISTPQLQQEDYLQALRSSGLKAWNAHWLLL